MTDEAPADDLDVSPEVSREEIQRRVDEARTARDLAAMRKAMAAARDAVADGAIDDLERRIALSATPVAVKAAAPFLRELGRWEANNAITWDTSCLNCSTLLDGAYAETMRAETAERELAKYRAALIDMLNLSGSSSPCTGCRRSSGRVGCRWRISTASARSRPVSC